MVAIPIEEGEAPRAVTVSTQSFQPEILTEITPELFRCNAPPLRAAGDRASQHNADVQMRVMVVPDSWVPPNPGLFQKDVMNSLGDLGEQMGADPVNWRTEPP